MSDIQGSDDMADFVFPDAFTQIVQNEDCVPNDSAGDMHNISGSSVDTTTSVATSASNGSNAPVVAGGFKIEPRDRAPPIRFVPPKHNLAAQSVVASAPSGFAKAPPLKIPFQPINRLAATGSAFPSSSLSLNLNQQHTPGQPQQASALKRKPEADPEALPTKRGRFVDENVIPLSTAAAPSPAGTPSTTLRESGSASERPTSAQARSNSAATRCVKRSRLVEPSSDEVVEVEAPLPKSRKSAESTGDGGGNAPRSKAKSVLDADEDDDGDSENGLEPSTSKPKVAVPKKAKSSTKKTKAVENNMSIKMGFQNAKKLEHATKSRLPGQAVDDVVGATPLFEEEMQLDNFLTDWTIEQLKEASTDKTDSTTPRVIIARCGKHIRALAAMPYGVQWAAARHVDGIEKLSMDEFRQLDVRNNVVGVPSLLAKIGCLNDLEAFPQEVLEELDREESVLKRTCATGTSSSSASGLGCWSNLPHPANATPDSHPELFGWYGGKIEFAVSIRHDVDKKYHAVCLPLKLGPSNRIKRFGSWNTIGVSISSKAEAARKDTIKQEMQASSLKANETKKGRGKPAPQLNDVEIDAEAARRWATFFLDHRFELFGHLFQVWASKDVSKRFLYRTKSRTISTLPPAINALDVAELIELLNPPRFNSGQSMTKWVARFLLSLSDTVPAVRLAPENIRSLEDIFPENVSKELAESWQTMTDGCGLANPAFFTMVKQALGLQEEVDAVQMRLAGAKGVLLRFPHDKSREPVVWLRDSQIKIKFATLACDDPSSLKNWMTVVEVNRVARAKTGVRISAGAIMVLVANGVPEKAILALLGAMFQEFADTLMAWDGVNALIRVAEAIDKVFGVFAGRRGKAAGSAARAQGLREAVVRDDSENHIIAQAEYVDIGDESDSDDGEGDDDAAEKKPERRAKVNEFASKAEEAVELLLHLFDPRTCPQLTDDIRFVMKQQFDLIVSKYHVLVPQSVEAILVPDPFGVLEEGEVFFCSSTPFLDQHGRMTNQLMGDVLIYRNPLRLRTDVQKVSAVMRRELLCFRDVIIVSVKGRRSLPSKLSGGDMDGDTAVIICNLDLVVPFTNAPSLKVMDPPADFKPKYFDTSTVKLRTFLESPDATLGNLLLTMYSACNDKRLVGRISALHENTAYKHGPDHESAVLQAHMFNTELDGAKSGDKVKPEVLALLSKDSGGTAPFYKVKAKNLTTPVTKRLVKGRHILDAMWDEGQKFLTKILRDYDERLRRMKEGCSNDLDKTPANAWLEFVARVESAVQQNNVCAAEFQQIRKAIEEFVKKIRDRQTEVARERASWNRQLKEKKTTQQVFDRQRAAWNIKEAAIRSDFAQGPRVQSLLLSNRDLAVLPASYAFHRDVDGPKPADPFARFAFFVASPILCRLRAEASGQVLHVYPESSAIHMPPRVR